MKKLFTAMFSLAIIISLSILTSCRRTPSNSDVKIVIEKYDDKGEISEKDYTVLLDYLDAAMDEAIPLEKEMQEARKEKNYDKLELIQIKYEKIERKYEYAKDASNIIYKAYKEDLLNSSNTNKAEKLFNKAIEGM